MRLPFCLFAAALALGGCTQTGQLAMQASVAPDAAAPDMNAPVGDSSAPNADNPTQAIGFASFFAPAEPRLMAQAEHIPGDFTAPENPILPPSRPDFGDRPKLAALTPEAAPQARATGEAPALMNAPPLQTSAGAQTVLLGAQAASLGAYEFKAAGAPLPAGGLSATNVAFAPGQFELAGARTSAARSGGARWRAAYDHVRTDCFPETLRRALDQIASHFNSEVLVTSGMRNRGRRGSLHRACKAADIRVVGVSPAEVARVARKIPGVNGVGTYRRVAVTHIDMRAERFAWRW